MPALRWDIRQANQELLVVFLGLLAVNALFFAFFARPRLEEYRTLNTENSPRLQEVERKEAAVLEREGYLQGFQKVEDDLSRWKKEVLQTRDERMIKVQAELAGLAVRFSVNMEQVQYQNDILEDEGLERFAMTLPLQGGYANLRKFIHAVEGSKELIVLERVALAEGEEGGVMLTLNITLATYFDLPELQRQARPGPKGVRKA